MNKSHLVTNKTLFSQHFIEHRLPALPEWAEEITPLFEQVRALYAHARRFGHTWNEAQTEEEFVKPVLRLLGWEFIVQTKSRRGGRVNRPDYALFADEATKREAMPHQGNDDTFYSRTLAIAEAKYWGRPLSAKDASGRDTWKTGENPSHQMVSYLIGTRCAWGILTNGMTWRLYSREVSSVASQFYEIDLSSLFEFLPDDQPPSEEQIAHFKRWYLFFRKAAFLPDGSGKSFVQRVLEGSETYAREVSDKLKDLVFRQVMPLLAGGFIAYRYHEKGIQEETSETLAEIYRASLSLLYKLLFLLYAEARALLPIENSAYRRESLTELAKWIAQQIDQHLSLSDSTYATPLYDRLLALFRRVDRGDPALGIPRYNGGLFSPKSPENRFLETHKLSDRAIALAIDALVRDAGQPVDYAFISVRNLGSIYEGLLENRLQVVNAAAGKVELVNDKGERKATGSYYTPDYIVEYIIRNTLTPILDEREKAFGDAMLRIAELRKKLERASDHATATRLRTELEQAESQAREAFLGIKVLDPAMGSGHFLVNAVDFLTDEIIRRMQVFHDAHPDIPWAWNPIQALIERVRQDILAEMQAQGIRVEAARLNDTALLTRLVMKRCIYGVDLNPMAVELAKLSLWLHSFTVGAPLSFLDHHLRCGNSLIGTDVHTVEHSLTEIKQESKTREEAKRRARARGEAIQEVKTATQFSLWGGPFSGLLDLTAVMTEIAERADATLADVRQSAEAFDSFRQSLTPYKEILDLWVSQFFGNARALEFLTSYRENLLDALQGRMEIPEIYQETLQTARRLAAEKRFFHWDLEFPEVFVDLKRRDWAENPGFDAVVGNPPYLRTELLSQEFKNYLARNYKSILVGRPDAYIFFLYRAGTLCAKDRGYFSMITPAKYTLRDNGKGLRKWIFENCDVNSLIDLSKCPSVFPSVIVYPMISVFKSGRSRQKQSVFVVIAKSDSPEDAVRLPYGQVVENEVLSSNLILQTDLAKPPRFVFNLGAGTREDITLNLLDKNSVSFFQVCDSRQGIIAGEVEKYIVPVSKVATLPIEWQQLVKPIITGADVERYFIPESSSVIVYDPRLLTAARDPLIFERDKKIIMQDISDRLEAGIDDKRQYALDTTTIVFMKDENLAIEFILSIINSYLIHYYYRQRFSGAQVRGGYLRFRPQFVDQLPIRRIIFETPPADRARLAAEGLALVEQAIASQGGLSDYSAFLASPLGAWLEARLSASPEQSDVIHDLLAELAQRMIAMNQEKQAEVKGFLTWLERQIGAKMDDLSGKSQLRHYLGDYQKGEKHLTFEELLSILRKNQKKLAVNLSARNFQENLEREYNASLGKLLPLKARLAATDRLIDLIVYRLYGLTEEEVQVVEGNTSR